jgi:hypothetical protein
MRLNILAFVSTAVIFFTAASASAGLGLGLGFSQNSTSVYSGRYAYIHDDNLLLDTETGKMWHLVSSHGEKDKLVPVPYEDLTGKKVGVYPEPQDTTLQKGR